MNKLFTRIGVAFVGIAMAVGVGVAVGSNKKPVEVNATTTYSRLDSFSNIDESASYVLGIDGVGFHYSGTSSWGLMALPSAQTPLYYTLTKGENSTFKAHTTVDDTTYYLQVPGNGSFTMNTSSTAANTTIILGTTTECLNGEVQTSAVSNSDYQNRMLRQGSGGIRSYTSTTGKLVYFYKVVTTDPTLSLDKTYAKIKKDDATGATFTATTQNGDIANLTWTNNSTSILNVTDNGDGTAKITGKSEGTGTVTVSFLTATPITITVRVFELASGTSAANAYAVEDIIYQIDKSALASGTTYYVTGVVSSVVNAYNTDSHKQSVYIKDSYAGATETFELYNVECAFDPAIVVGDTLTAYGAGSKYVLYKSTYELNGGNLYTDSLKGLSSIAISGTLAKSEYNAGETFDPTGLTVTATFDNGSQYVVTNYVAWTPSPFAGGETSVRATYTYNGDSATADKNVTVSTKTVSSIAVATAPSTTNYYVGEKLNPSGLSLTVNYTVGDPETITEGFEIDNRDYVFTYADSVAGTKQYTVSYGGKSTTFNVTIKKTVITDSNKTDSLDAELIGTKSYTDWSEKSAAGGSSAVYAGNTTSVDGYEYIQFRSSNNSGIITTTSGGIFHSIEIEWNAGKSTATRTLEIYGSNTAYTASSNLYNNSLKGTLIGTLTLTYDDGNKVVTSAETKLETGADLYRYIGIRSNNGALYLDYINIKWASPAADADVTAVDGFVSGNMHLDHVTNDGSCKSQGWYSAAVTAFGGLTANQKAIILNSTSNYGTVSDALWTYRQVRDRLAAWAEANGETFNTSTGVFSVARFVTPLSNNIDGGQSVVIVIAVLSAITLMAIAGCVILKRKER